MTKKEIIALLLKRIDLKGLLVEDVLQLVIKKALDKVVQDSSNPYDNIAMAALYPPLEKAIVEAVDELLRSLQN